MERNKEGNKIRDQSGSASPEVADTTPTFYVYLKNMNILFAFLLHLSVVSS